MRRRTTFAIAGMAGALLLAVAAGPVSAQDDDYPSTPPPPGGQPTLTITTDKPTYQEGTDVLVKVCGFRVGSGDAGMVTYRGTNKIAIVEQGDGCGKPSGGSTAAGLGGGELAAAFGPAAVAQTAAFPSGSFKATPVGSGDVCAVATGYNTPCTPISITGVSGGGGDTPRGSSPLGKTGFELALYLAIALILLVIGANLVQWSRRRRRRLARAREAAHVQAHRERQLTHH